MGFNYPTTPMDESFFADVRLFFRALPRLVPEAFLPDVWTPLLDKKGDNWCLTKASFLDTIFELRHAHASKYSLPLVASVEHMQQIWLQELDRFVTEYHKRHEEEIKIKAQVAKEAEIKEKEDKEKVEDNRIEAQLAVVVEPVVVKAKPKERAPLLNLAQVQLEIRRENRKRLAEIAATAAAVEEAAALERANAEHADHERQYRQQEMEEALAEAKAKGIVPVTVTAAKPAQSIQLDDSEDFFPSGMPEQQFPEVISLDSSGEGGNLYEDDFDEPVLPKQEEPVVAAVEPTLEHIPASTTVTEKEKCSKGFQFSFNGKDYVGAYWIVWVALIVVAALLLGVWSYAYLNTPTVVIVDEATLLKQEKQNAFVLSQQSTPDERNENEQREVSVARNVENDDAQSETEAA
jgi:hypothetical protein